MGSDAEAPALGLRAGEHSPRDDQERFPVFDTADFGHWDKATQAFVVERGDFDIQAGASSDDIRAMASLELK